MKTTITADSQGNVTLVYDHARRYERITREFSCPLDGGYVRDESGSQVCDRLQPRGSTLTASSRANLINVIRREYRAMRRAEAKAGA